MNVHPYFQTRLDYASAMLRKFPQEPTGVTLNLTAGHPNPDGKSTKVTQATCFHLGLNYLWPNFDEIVDPATGKHTGQRLSDLPPLAAADLLDNRDASVLAPVHLALATSLHFMTNHSPDLEKALLQQLEATGRRVIWQGVPYVPTARWDFSDGSALVQYADRIYAGVHATRLDDIREQYVKHATNGPELRGGRPAPPLAPNPRYALANDGLYSHQAALPAGSPRCWCSRHHETDRDTEINRLRP